MEDNFNKLFEFQAKKDTIIETTMSVDESGEFKKIRDGERMSAIVLEELQIGWKVMEFSTGKTFFLHRNRFSKTNPKNYSKSHLNIILSLERKIKDNKPTDSQNKKF